MERPDPSAYELRSQRRSGGYAAFAWIPKGERAAEITAGRLSALRLPENVGKHPENDRIRQESHHDC